MGKIMKNELIRSFKSKTFRISLCISFVLVFWYSIERFPFCMDQNVSFSIFSEKMLDNFPHTSYVNWIGSHNLYIQQNIFYFLLPFLASLPFSSSFFTDLSSGYWKNILIREKKSFYLLSKYISIFISGGCAAVIPMLSSFLIACCFLPTMSPQVSYPFTNISSYFKWSELLFSAPLLYILLYLIITFFFAGLLACTALPISYFSAKSFLPIVFPFFIYIGCSMISELLSLEAFSLRNIIVTTDSYSNTFSCCFMLLFLFLISFVPYFIIGMKKEEM